MRTKHVVVILILLAVGLLPSPAQAGGVVTVCDEAHLLAALAGGGTVTISCSGTITLTAEITIAADTTIDDSGQDVTISGNFSTSEPKSALIAQSHAKRMDTLKDLPNCELLHFDFTQN